MTIFGLDFSHYDAVPLGSRVVSEGFTFMTHKAGGDANDAELAAWWSALKPYRADVLLGAYWVLYPGSPSSRADSFVSRLYSQCPGWSDGPFILQVDCEKWNDDSGTVPSKSEVKTFCDRLHSRFPKLTPIVYGPEWVYGDKLSGLGYPLWASRYVTGSGTAIGLYPGDSSSKWDAYSGQIPAILQFTSSANALGQTTCDANAFRGSLAELTALVAPGWAEDMATTITPDDIDAIATATANKVLKLDGVIANAPGAGDIAGNPTISLATAEGREYDLLQRLYNLWVSGAMTSAIATAVVAALPPAATGGLTADQVVACVEQGMTSVLTGGTDAVAG